jgi:hypothetical protein
LPSSSQSSFQSGERRLGLVYALLVSLLAWVGLILAIIAVL